MTGTLGVTGFVTGSHLPCTADPRLFASTDVVDHTVAAAKCTVCKHLAACADDVVKVEKASPGVLVGTYAGHRFGGP